MRPMPANDPFPRDRFTAVAGRLPAYARLAWRLARDPLLSKARRATIVAAAGYLLSPVDAVPGVVPVLGQLDDLLVAFAAIKVALAGLSPAQRQAHLGAVGLDDHTLAADIRAVGITAAWIGRATGRLTTRGAKLGARSVAGGVRMGGRGAGAVARRIRRRMG
jgi:uncharacterized membrane protein YkvA (DUF1232 family)